MHTPVLWEEALNGLAVKRDGFYIDATAGEGGHLKKILDKGGSVLAIDWDMGQLKRLEEKFPNEPNLVLTAGNFKDIEEITRENEFYPADGVILDLGLSLGQLEQSGRGFSFKKTREPLDMRINESKGMKASELVNSLKEDELYEIFAKNSEEINSRAIAKAIVSARRLKKIETVGDLIDLLNNSVEIRGTSTYSRIFQALRMEVNQELENLKKGLEGAMIILKKRGRLVVISFHSVEDRLVKKFYMKQKENLKELEVVRGRRGFERSATLRIFEKI